MTQKAALIFLIGYKLKGRWIALGVWISIHLGLFFSQLTVSYQIASCTLPVVWTKSIWCAHGNELRNGSRLAEGVILEDGPARFTDIVQHPESDQDRFNQWFYVVLMEGRNREVRRLWEFSLQVNRRSVRYLSCIFLPSFLKRGHFVELVKRGRRFEQAR